jgi:magnesium chelatase family protein
MCPPSLVLRYQRRISGPFIDRVDILVEVPHIEYEKLAENSLGEKSEKVRPMVEVARATQRPRFAGTKIACNSEMRPAYSKISRSRYVINNDSKIKGRLGCRK